MLSLLVECANLLQVTRKLKNSNPQLKDFFIFILASKKRYFCNEKVFCHGFKKICCNYLLELLQYCKNLSQLKKSCYYFSKQIELLKHFITEKDINLNFFWSIPRVGHTFFSKERNVLAFFYFLYTRMRRSLQSFMFFTEECGIHCVLLHSL